MPCNEGNSLISSVTKSFLQILIETSKLRLLSLSNFISRFTGFLCLIISIIIVYLHVFAWGDNLFSHGPFVSLNIEEGKKAVFGQFLLIPISIYILFNNRLNLSAFSETK